MSVLSWVSCFALLLKIDNLGALSAQIEIYKPGASGNNPLWHMAVKGHALFFQAYR